MQDTAASPIKIQDSAIQTSPSRNPSPPKEFVKEPSPVKVEVPKIIEPELPQVPSFDAQLKEIREGYAKEYEERMNQGFE